jgi:ribosomal-protein-alanine N-acetyltransferase
MHYTVQKMQLRDIPQAIEVDRECFPPHWPAPPYKRDLRSNTMAHYLVAYDVESQAATAAQASLRSCTAGRLPGKLRSLLVRKRGLSCATQRIDGVIGLWLMVDEAHIITLGVRQRCRRQGVGELLLIYAIDLAIQLNARMMTLEVSSSNEAAQALYRKYGFTNVGLRRGYYGENREDAVIMSTDTITSSSFQELFQRSKRSYAEKRTNQLAAKS